MSCAKRYSQKSRRMTMRPWLAAALFAAAMAKPAEAQDLFVDWTNGTTGVLGSVTVTASSFTSSNLVRSYDLSGPDYSAAPGSTSQEVISFSGNSDWSVSFSEPVTGLRLYLYSWRSPYVYTFSEPFTVASGLSGATVTGNQIINSSSYFMRGIITFAGPLTSLTVNSTAGVGEFSSQAMTFGMSACTAPSITLSPVDVDIFSGDNASFSVTADGTSPLSYQWRKDGVNLSDGGVISGATTATLLLTGATGMEAGNYDCVVANTCGSVTCSAAALTVHLPEMEVRYNGVAIANGDDTPSTADGTDFGSAVAAPGNFVARTFTIANTGSAALNLTGALPRVQVSGPHASEFTVLVPPASSVSAGSTTTFAVHFHPEAPGLRTAIFSIPNDDGDENPYEFVVQGTGEAPPPEFVFLANKITLEETKQNTPGGDMHSNGTLLIEKGEPSTYNSNLTAVGKITIEKRNTITGNVRSQTSISNSGKITGTKTTGAVAAVPLPSLSYSAGGPNKTVPSGGSLTLAPGSYGIVTMSNNGTLKLFSGEYFMTELRYSSSIEGGKIEIDLSSGDPVVINVVSNLQLGHEAAIVLLHNGESDSKLVTFNTLQSTSANWGREAYLVGSFNAPNAKVTLVKNTQLRGSISAKEIFVSNDCLFLYHDAPGSLPGPGDLPKFSFDEDEAVISSQHTVTSYELLQNYPNPFNPSTAISFALPEASEVTLSIFNTNGQLVKQLVAGAMNAGRHNFTWDATDERGQRVASGVYLYVLNAGEFTAQRRLLLLK